MLFLFLEPTLKFLFLYWLSLSATPSSTLSFNDGGICLLGKGLRPSLYKFSWVYFLCKAIIVFKDELHNYQNLSTELYHILTNHHLGDLSHRKTRMFSKYHQHKFHCIFIDSAQRWYVERTRFDLQTQEQMVDGSSILAAPLLSFLIHKSVILWLTMKVCEHLYILSIVKKQLKRPLIYFTFKILVSTK